VEGKICGKLVFFERLVFLEKKEWTGKMSGKEKKRETCFSGELGLSELGLSQFFGKEFLEDGKNADAEAKCEYDSSGGG
jgi:hypothetical protein